MSTRHENCTPAYTLSARLAGTYRVAVPVSQGAVDASPKAELPIAVRLLGRVMLDKLLHW